MLKLHYPANVGEFYKLETALVMLNCCVVNEKKQEPLMSIFNIYL